MGNLDGYNADEHEPIGHFAPVPEGTYRVMIVESELKDNSQSTGSGFALKFLICDNPELAGRTLFDWVNWEHSNPDVEEMGKRRLSAICRAVGVMEPKDTGELHDKPLDIYVVVKKRPDNGELSNNIKGYYRVGEAPDEKKEPVKSGSKSDWMKK
jgi:hypothetical protein